MTNGLDALNARRNRGGGGGRSMPKPLHSPRSTPVAIPAQRTSDHDRDAAVEATTSADASAVEVETAPPPAATVSVTDAAEARGSEAIADTSPEVHAVVKSSIYLDTATDDFLEEVRIRGRKSKPKIDASRSAVVRLALARLEDQMDADQVIRELLARAAPQGGPGRRRL